MAAKRHRQSAAGQRTAGSCAAGVISLLLVLATVAAAQTMPTEYDVEAAYLFNFAKFMHEPAHAPNSFRIGVLGRNPFGGTLDEITAHETIDGRSVQVLQLTSAEEARSCDIVFVSDSEASRLDKDLAAMRGADVLTVSNIPRFLDHGGMIAFLLASNRVRFAVNLDAVNRSRISLSSELLKVALSISGRPAPEAQP